jgi:hypothetical protein
MADAARLALVARRNELCRFSIVVTGIDLTGVDLRAQFRLRPDSPGAPLIQLNTVTSLAAEGLKLDSVVTSGPQPVSIIRGRINATTMTDATKVPYMGEVGDDTVLAWAMQWSISGDAQTRIYGDFIVQASAYGSDNAPVNRAVGYGSSNRSSGGGSGDLTFGDQVIAVTIDGAGILGPLISSVQATLDSALAVASTLDPKRGDIAYGSNVSLSAVSAATTSAANGAVLYDYTGATGVPGVVGGWKIPAGSTGRGTQAGYVWRFAPRDAAMLGGQKVRFSATLETSPALLIAIPQLAVTVVSDAPGQVIDKGAVQIDDTHIVVWADYIGAGTEKQITLSAQVPISQAAVASDVFAVLVLQTATFLGLSGGASVTDELALEAQDRLPEASNLPTPTTANGAALVYGGNLLTPKGIDVPSGSTGNGSSIVKWLLASDLGRYAGETVRATVDFAASDYLLDPAKGFFATLAVSVNGAVSYAAAVANSTIITRPFRNPPRRNISASKLAFRAVTAPRAASRSPASPSAAWRRARRHRG